MVAYSQADNTDLEPIIGLLKICNLPFSDITESRVDFIVAKYREQLIGCIGIEFYGSNGLVRSFAVDNNYRKNGIGGKLYSNLLKYVIEKDVNTLHLLTTTAQEYFAQKGFKDINRSNAPEAIQNSREFACLCPSSSVYMVLELKEKR